MDPTGEIVPVVAPVVFVGAVIGVAASAFEVKECFLSWFDGCSDGNGNPCQSLAIGVVAGIATGGIANYFKIFKVGKYIGRFGDDLLRKTGDDFFAGTKNSQKVINQINDGDFHGFPESVKAFQDVGVRSTVRGGDGILREQLKIPGNYRGRDGNFEFIKEPDGTISHHFFSPN